MGALQNKINRLTALIAATEKLLAECRKSLETNKVNLENLTVSLANKQDQCAAWSAEYAAFCAEAERELDILNKLREHIVEKGEASAAYLAERAKNAPKF